MLRMGLLFFCTEWLQNFFKMYACKKEKNELFYIKHLENPGAPLSPSSPYFKKAYKITEKYPTSR